MLQESLVQTYMTYAFVRLLTTDWDKTDAFKAGLIDKNGVLLKKVADMTPQEKDSYSMWTRLVFNIKRLLEKVPFGKSTLVRYASALWLLKENLPGFVDMEEILEALGIDRDTCLTEEEIEGYSGHLVEDSYYFNPNTAEFFNTYRGLRSFTEYLGVPLFRQGETIFSEADVVQVSEDLSHDSSRQLFELYRYFTNPDLLEDMVTTAAIAGARDGDEPPVRVGTFGKHKWFESDDADMFKKVRLGKKKHARYDKYVGDGPVGRAVRAYGLSNPKEPIILKDKLTGSMLYLKHPK